MMPVVHQWSQLRSVKRVGPEKNAHLEITSILSVQIYFIIISMQYIYENTYNMC